MRRFLFVGERQSPKAAAIRATWQNGGLAARSLHDALLTNGISLTQCQFINLWSAPGLGTPKAPPRAHVLNIAKRRARDEEWTVIALGRRVAKEFTVRSIPHRYAVHPAARGSIRKKERYALHIRSALGIPPVPKAHYRVEET